MKFIVDDKIPYIKGALEPFGEVVYLAGKETTPEVVKDANAIVTRTRTLCNADLLKGSAVSMIATATIGFDHIDTQYCEANNINWTNAPGCNSGSVEQYVASALSWFSTKKRVKLKGKTLGIVGVGNVGKKVQKIGELFEMNVLLNDPPRAKEEGEDEFVDLDKIKKEADVISFHTPMTRSGEDATLHLADQAFFDELKRKPLIINSSRGEVVETEALKNALQAQQINGAIIDCWENEPNIDEALVKLVDIATPHIAGYSKDGKANGTSMSIQAISKHLNLGIDNWKVEDIEAPLQPEINIETENKTEEEIIKSILLRIYNLIDDDAALREDLESFERLRGDYPVRREYLAYSLDKKKMSESVAEKLSILGFTVE